VTSSVTPTRCECRPAATQSWHGRGGLELGWTRANGILGGDPLELCRDQQASRRESERYLMQALVNGPQVTAGEVERWLPNRWRVWNQEREPAAVA
jgi:hypothetical protein